jgi:hypothetical protein
MAEVEIARFAARSLPNVCMRCGQPATVTRSKVFREALWSCITPLRFFLIVTGIGFPLIPCWILKRANVTVPLCDIHKNHFARRLWVMWGGFFSLLVAALFNFACSGSRYEWPFGLVAGASVAWAILCLVLVHFSGIACNSMDEVTIVLFGVSDEFIDAYEDIFGIRDPFKSGVDKFLGDVQSNAVSETEQVRLNDDTTEILSNLRLD